MSVHIGSDSPVLEAGADHEFKLERTISEASTHATEDGLTIQVLDDILDGPALTPDGKALDLDGGAPLFFAYTKELSPSHDRTVTAKRRARELRARRADRAGDLVAAGEVCSVDASGVVRGEAAMAPPLSGDGGALGRAAHLKLYHHKLRSRRGRSAPEQPTLCIDKRDKAVVYLDLGGKADRLQRFRRKRAERNRHLRGPSAGGRGCEVGAVDGSGRVWSPEELPRAPAGKERPSFVQNLFTLAPGQEDTQAVVYELVMEEAMCEDAKMKAEMTYGVEVPRLCVGMPPLQSDLGKWAEWAVQAEEWQSRVLGVPVKYSYNADNSESSDDDSFLDDGEKQ